MHDQQWNDQQWNDQQWNGTEATVVMAAPAMPAAWLPPWEGQPEVVTIPAAARLLGISAKRLRRWVREDDRLWGRLTVRLAGRRLVVTRRLRRYLDTG